MWKCGNCGTEVENRFNSCWNCGYGEDGAPPENREVFDGAKRDVQASMPPQTFMSLKSGSATALRICGVIYLVGSIIGALVVLGITSSSGSGAMTFYVMFSIAALVYQGIFVFVLANVTAEIAERVKAIDYNLSKEGEA